MRRRSRKSVASVISLPEDVHQLDQYGGIGPLHTLEADLVDAAQSV